MNRKAAIYLLSLVIYAPVGFADTGWVDYSDDLLSVEFDSTALDEALAITSEETGVRFSINPKAQGSVSDRFERLSLEAGIRRMLAGYNYIMLFDTAQGGKKRVNRVVIMDKVGQRGNFMKTNKALTIERPALEPGEPVILKRQKSGHYIAAGTINARSVDFIVDTGATVVAVSGGLAKRLGLGRGAPRSVNTANGTATGYETTLGRVSLGNLSLDNVKAIILPKLNADRGVLLGMSFLGAFELIQRNGELTIKPQETKDETVAVSESPQRGR